MGSLAAVPFTPHICPWTLLQAYAKLTDTHLPAGTFVFVNRFSSFRPSSANYIGSLNRQGLDQLEQRCEIAKWKNVGSFASHYLR